jgi:hypothetical protein
MIWQASHQMYAEPEDCPKPGKPRCENCGGFLSYKAQEIDYTYGYAGLEVTEKRWAVYCKKCKSWIYLD